MSHTKDRFSWWTIIVQWSCLIGLSAFAFINAATDHGIQMALNCFCLGFIAFSMMMRPLLDRRIESTDALMADLKLAEAAAIAAKHKFEQAINDGFIEVIPMVPIEVRPPTRH